MNKVTFKEYRMEEKRSTFGGSIGFVLAAAGSAVGLGNIWRFPYLAAKDGGGLFLVVYLIFALTFGFTLLTTEVAIGRKTKQGPLTAYSKIKKGWGFLGVLGCLVPAIILPYYSVIGGWVVKYFWSFLTGAGVDAAQDGYFNNFITSDAEPLIMMTIFFVAVAAIIIMGVNKGIEKMSKIVMPILLILVIGIAIFSITLKDPDSQRTGLQGLKILFVPNFEGIGIKEFFAVCVDAMGQLFFSLSIAMGIMIAYGSYVSDDSNLSKSINQIEIFDTGVAVLAGVMIVPAVFCFMGNEGLESSGPGLMFVALPKVFAQMGVIGNVVGCLFFAMVLFAALTSCISILEAVVSSFMDAFKISRVKATVIEGIIAFVIAIVVCLGYNKLYFEYTLPNGSVAQILDIMDYISNNVLMPIVSISTCILIGWIAKPKTVIDEVEKNGVVMGRKILYSVMIKFIAPILLIILFINSVGIIKIG